MNSTTAANFWVSLGDGSAGVTTGFRDLAGANETGRNKELAIWDAALSDADVYSLYNYGLPNNLGLADSYDTDRTTNLKLWWRMGDNNNGAITTVADQTGNGYTGTIVGGAEFVVDHPDGHKDIQVSLQDTEANILARSQDRIGRTALATDTEVLYVFDGSAWQPFPFTASFSNTFSVSFDGVDDYAAVPSTITLSGNKSISYWAKLDAFNAGFAGRNTSHYTILHNNSTSILVRFGATPFLYTVPAISTGVWNHYAFTGDGTDFKLYINGNLEASGTDYGDVYITMIGAVTATYANLNGKLDEIGLFNSTLSPTAVSAIYNGGVPADLASYSPVHWWRMGEDDGGTGTTITDQGSGE